MITHCANPGCAAPLHYDFDGRLFQFEVRSHDGGSPVSSRKFARRVAHFWLCGRCCSNLSLDFDLTRGVQVVPLVPMALTREVPREQLPVEP
jgi:hypothetical protein